MEWLNSLLTHIADCFPRSYYLSPDEGGVRLTLGNRVKLLKPGWYYYWPLIQTCRGIKVVPQMVDLRPQSVLTKDKIDVIISGGIKYKVTDAAKALLDIHSYDEDLQTMALGIICDFVSKHRFNDISDYQEICDIIRSGVAEEAAGIGIKIMKVYITDIGRTKNIRMLGEGYGYTDGEDD